MYKKSDKNIKELRELALKYLGETTLTNYRIAKDTSFSETAVGKWKNGEVTKLTSNTAKTLISYFEAFNVENQKNIIGSPTVDGLLILVADRDRHISRIETEIKRLNREIGSLETELEASKKENARLLEIIASAQDGGLAAAK